MQGWFVGGLDFDDVTGSSGGVVEDVFIALGYMEIVVRDGLHVEAPAGIAAGAEGIVDHVAYGCDSHVAHAVEGTGTDGEELVGPEEIGLFGPCDSEQIAVETADGGTHGKAEGDLIDRRVWGIVVEGVEGNDLMAKTFQSPGSIET